MKSIGAILLLISSISAIALEPVSFEREVLPLLEHRCNECHHPEEMRGGLDLTRLSTMLRGGDEEGPALVPGKPDESPMILMLTGKLAPAMPNKRDPLPPGEIELLSRWIKEGAKDDTPTFSSEDVAFFEREIRPVLYERCFKCHAGEEAENGLQLTSRHGLLLGGERGEVVVPGKPEQSLILSAVRHEGELKMPKGGDRLSGKQVEALEEWIRRGVPWPPNQKVLTRKKLFTISESDRNHWAFRPLPEKLPDDWKIDDAISKHLRGHGITPAPGAGPYALLRRVTFDLIGYPPTPDEIELFIEEWEAKGEDRAFSNVVNRLLEMPQFGWRWGRHWLDYTRNGANGQPNRGPSLDSNRYARWVARCFNEDRPWDWFARVHIAGDKMPAFHGDNDFSIDQALAATVPLNGPRTFQEAQTETFVLMDKLDEGVEFMGRSLLGISLECARCHDHKFDPVSQRDYYAMLGYFQSSWFAPLPETVDSRKEAKKKISDYRNNVAEMARLAGFIRKQSLELNVGGGGRTRAWYEKRSPKLYPVDKRLREMELEVFRGELENEKNPALADDLRTAIAELEERLKNYEPPEYTGFGSLTGYQHFIGGHKSELGLIKRAQTLGNAELVSELEDQLQFWIEERGRWGERSRFGGFSKSDPEVAALAGADDRIAAIKKNLPINPKQPWNDHREGTIIVRADGGFRRAEDLEPLDDAAKKAGLQFNSNNPDRVLMHDYFIGNSRLLLRGDVLTPGEVIERGTPGFFGTGPDQPEGSGRLQLADWLTSRGSIQEALVARTLVNRTWQNLFGTALCRTPKELGRLGEIPEMPDVIDGLSVRFIKSDWSVKKLIREIVTSETYRRTSVAPVEGDPQNRYFSRQSVRRLQSEAIMNTAASLRRGQRFHTPADREANLMAAAEYSGHFDGPTTDDLIERRTESITPTQALFLMNSNAGVRKVAGDLKQRIAAEGDLPGNLEEIYRHVLQRPVRETEREMAMRFQEKRADLSAEEIITEFIHLLMCSNEFLYIE